MAESGHYLKWKRKKMVSFSADGKPTREMGMITLSLHGNLLLHGPYNGPGGQLHDYPLMSELSSNQYTEYLCTNCNLFPVG